MKLHNKIHTHHWPILLLVLFFSASFIGCKKYEDGPWLSLRTKKDRLLGAWHVNTINGVDQSNDGEMVLFFQEETRKAITIVYKGNGEFVNESYTIKGSWTWKESKELIEIRANILKADWTILRLKKKEFWFLDEHNQIWKCEKN